MRNVYVDFEYIESKDKTKYHLICGVILDRGVVYKFDLRTNYHEIINYLKTIDTNEVRFFAYNITTAEVPVLCQIKGHHWIIETKWIDLWTEFKMFALTHEKYFTSSTGLSSALKMFKIEDKYEADKGKMRDLILYSKSQRGISEKNKKTRIETDEFIYTDEEFEKIMFYCEQDVLILPRLVEKLNQISAKYEIKVSERLRRGEHCKFAGISYYYHKGYPMDVDRVKEVFNNIPKIKESLMINCNQLTSFEIYKSNYKGPQKNKVFSHYSFNMENFGEYLKTKNLFDIWEKTKTGLKLDEEYLDDMLSFYKDILDPIYQARNTIKQLNSTNLSELLTEDGYIKSVSWPYNQKTSRTSPKPKLGFILNLAPWLRMLIKPKPGRAFVGIDFKSQEVLIAACLSQDDSMLEDYMTDIYMGQAIKTGFAPEGATKKTHGILRDAFKPIVLGTQFGMQAKSLSIRFFNMYKSLNEQKNLEECEYIARNFLDKHKQAYYKYHNFLKKHCRDTLNRGYYKTLDNWYYFTNSLTKSTALENIPCQSGGGAMTRLAHDECVRQGIDVIQLHDALYFECLESEARVLAARVSKIMCDASEKLLGNSSMSTETKIFTSDVPYYDPRGEQIYRFVMSKLELDCPAVFKKPAEIKDIHKI
jgi:hypothetical protein